MDKLHDEEFNQFYSSYNCLGHQVKKGETEATQITFRFHYKCFENFGKETESN
jgi:hypothetical protein